MSQSSTETLSIRHGTMKNLRASWEAKFTELTTYFMPEISMGMMGTRPQDARTLLDSTGPEACQMFASGLSVFLHPQEEKWLQLEFEDHFDFEHGDWLDWLETATRLVEKTLANPKSRFYAATHESYFSLGVMGTGVVSREWPENSTTPIFRSVPLSACYFDVNHLDVIDTVDRIVKMRGRQILSMFTEAEIPAAMLGSILKDPSMSYDVVHSVFPRNERIPGRQTSKNKAYASVWWVDGQGVLRESGYDHFPYGVSRWFTYPSEIYSLSPGSACLPEMRCLVKLEELLLQDVALKVLPPWLVPSSGVRNPADMVPGGLISYEFAELGNLGPDAIRPLQSAGRYDVGEDKLAQKRDVIRRAFLVDLFEREIKKERQTALEISDQRQQMLNLVSPHLSRVVTEYVTPTLLWTLDQLIARKLLPPPPAEMKARELKVTYTSPAAAAQIEASGNRAKRFLLEDIVPLLQVQPDVIQAIDVDRYLQYIATVSNVPRTVLRSSEELTGIREKAEQERQMTGAAEMAQPVSAAVKNLAQAGSLGAFGAG